MGLQAYAEPRASPPSALSYAVKGPPRLVAPQGLC
jgi:hypothetical protein